MVERPLILPFGKFAKGDYEESQRNLYIVWRGKQCLYVGVSQDDIWIRWFHRHRCHIEIEGDEEHETWCGVTTIGKVITGNRPASLQWKIELRHIPSIYDGKLAKAERDLIHELQPLFNVTHRRALNRKENRLHKLLLEAIG